MVEISIYIPYFCTFTRTCLACCNSRTTRELHGPEGTTSLETLPGTNRKCWSPTPSSGAKTVMDLQGQRPVNQQNELDIPLFLQQTQI